MKELQETYFSMQMTLFPMPEEEKIENFEKMKEFLNTLELVKPPTVNSAFLSLYGRKSQLFT